MEFYKGYLIPASGTTNNNDSIERMHRQNEHLRHKVRKLEKTVKRLEKSQRKNQYSQQNHQFIQFRSKINNKRLQDQNMKLRQENKVLNQYFHTFAIKYEENRQQLRRLSKSRDKKSNNMYSQRTQQREQISSGKIASRLRSLSGNGKFRQYNFTKISKYVNEDEDNYTRGSEYRNDQNYI